MPGCFEKFIFELEAFSYSIGMGLNLAKQLTSPQKMFVSSAEFTVLISWSPVCTPLIPYFIIEIGDSLGCNNKEKHGEWAILQNYLHDEGKGVREETIYFYF